MVKSGQINNSEEFLKLFPNHSKLHFEDLKLRKRFQDLKKSFYFDYVSSFNKEEADRAFQMIKVNKSRIIRKKGAMIDYEFALIRLRRGLYLVNEDIKRFITNDESIEIEKIENSLLKLPSRSLKKLLVRIIKKTGIFLNSVESDDQINPINLFNLINKLKENYECNLEKYTQAEKRHILNTFICLEKRKSDSKNHRVTRNYRKKIFQLREYLSK